MKFQSIGKRERQKKSKTCSSFCGLPWLHLDKLRVWGHFISTAVLNIYGLMCVSISVLELQFNLVVEFSNNKHHIHNMQKYNCIALGVHVCGCKASIYVGLLIIALKMLIAIMIVVLATTKTNRRRIVLLCKWAVCTMVSLCCLDVYTYPSQQ